MSIKGGKEMKHMKRLMAWLLVVCMLIGIVPGNVFAAESEITEQPLATAISGSDVDADVTVAHTYASTDTYADTSTDASTDTSTDVSGTNGVVENYTTTVQGTKTVYKLVSELTSGKEYLIVNTNTAGDAYGLGSSTSGISVTVKAADSICDAAYVEDKGDVLEWTAGDGWTFTSGEYTLGISQHSNNGPDSEPNFNSYSLDLTGSTVSDWTLSNNRLYSSITNGGPSKTNYYLRFSNETWSVTSGTNNVSNVYFYEKTDVTVSESASGTVSLEAGEYLSLIIDTGENAVNTVNFDPIIYFGETNQTSSFENLGGTYTYSVISDSNDIISGITNDTGIVALNKKEGSATVRVEYTWTENDTTYTVWDTVEINTSLPYYTIDITDGSKPIYDASGENVTGYESVEGTLILKGVNAGDTYDLNYVVTSVSANGVTEDATCNVTWTCSDATIASIDVNGVVTLTGVEGQAYIEVKYQLDENTAITDTIKITTAVNHSYTPEDGGENFPEYPNEGAIRFDKTAQAVGNFSETGIAQLELSMTGVPFTTGNEMDVVLMLDITGSMTDTRISATKAAAIVFVESIVINEDDTYNNNRVGIYSFNNSGVNTVFELGTITSDTELDSVKAAINSYNGKQAEGGTPYDVALKECYDVLQAAKADDTGNNRTQACVFMTDGCPTDYAQYQDGSLNTLSSASDIQAMFTGTSYDTRDTDYAYEYYSTLMKQNNVTVYSVGLGLNNTNTAWSGSTATQCLNAASILLNDISGPAKEASQPDAINTTTLSKAGTYFYSVADADAATEMKVVFSNIAQKILDAAKDVKVTDKISDDYTMVFDAPNETIEGELTDQEFYIEVNDYQLVPVKDTNGTIIDYERGTATSLIKVYMGENEDGSYYAASDAAGTKFADPVFSQTAIGSKYYWTTDSTVGDTAVAVTTSGVTYYFVAAGNGTHNMISGAYAYGTPTTETSIIESTNQTEETTTYNNLLIVTPYFVYNAATRMLVWTAEKLSTSELTLTYFLYLNGSGGCVGSEDETDAGTYPTNDYANLHYTNYLGNDCEQIFPVPQMTWNGAQVSYVFYLVNEDGTPVNRAGRAIPFSEAVYVTDIYTYSVIWNDNDATGMLEAAYLAKEIVPDVYELFDTTAEYDINVYEDESGVSKNNNFTIAGNSELANTTYVFNTKADKTKYNVPGTYTEENVHSGFDFSNTTVAFAVLWKPELVEDVVVIDYGLPVAINVAHNDNVAGTVTGVNGGDGILDDIAINKGQITNKLYFPQKIVPDGFSDLEYGTAEVLSGTSVLYTPISMNMKDTETFYYITSLNYYQSNELITSRMYSSVTVIPATSVYYEDTFVVYKHSSGSEEQTGDGAWTTVGTEMDTTQACDRPGFDFITESYDANNIYGYDGAYDDCPSYSQGSAHKVTVSSDVYANDGNWPTASFTFTGTGFDIISQTSNTTGTITVNVVNDDGSYNKTWIVDTYYGYTCLPVQKKYTYIKYTFIYGNDGAWHANEGVEVESNVLEEGETTEKPENPKVGDQFVIFKENHQWIATTDTDNTLYQIPVIKSPELGYDTYTVTITPRYAEGFNHTANPSSYDFYLDAVRVYGPLNDGVVTKEDGTTDTTALDAYKADNEAYPEYVEIRQNLLAQNAFDPFKEDDNILEGAVFIDGFGESNVITDYSEYGPNNEVYLEKGQAVAFKITDANYEKIAAAHLGVKAPNGGTGSVSVTELTTEVNEDVTSYVASNSTDIQVNTATELYYDIRSCLNFVDGITNVIVIENTGEELVSLTNVKVTHSEAGTENGIALAMNYESSEAAATYVRTRLLASVPTEVVIPEIYSVESSDDKVYVGETVNLSIVTSSDAFIVTVNGEDAELVSADEENGTLTWAYSTEPSEEGTMELVVIAYSESGNTGDPMTAVVEVELFTAQNIVNNVMNHIKNWLKSFFS